MFKKLLNVWEEMFRKQAGNQVLEKVHVSDINSGVPKCTAGI